jgi:hypothetical protein
MAGSTLEQIAALVERLAPVGSKTRGMPIEAEDWNTLVGVLQGILAVDRGQEQGLVEGLQDRFAPLNHEHLGQVGVDWLDADLQSRQGEAGAGASTSIRTAVAVAGQTVRGFGDDLGRLRTQIEDQQSALDRSLTAESDRNTRLRNVEGQVGSVAELKSTVGSLARDVATGAARTAEVLDLRQRLTDATGKPIDLGALTTRVQGLEDLGRNLQGVDGKPVRLTDIELALRDLQDATGTGQGLEQRLNTLGAALETKLGSRLDEQTQALRTEFQSTLATSSQGLQQDLDSKLGAARTALGADLDGKLAARDAAVAARLDGMSAALDARQSEFGRTSADSLAAATAALRDDMQRAVDAKGADLATSLRASLATDLGALVAAKVTEATGPMGDRLGSVEKKVGDALAGLSSQIDASASAAVEAATGRLSDALAAQVATAREAIESQVSTLVAQAVDARSGDLDARVATAVATQLAGLDGRIANAVAVATRDLPAQIQRETQTQIAALNLAGQLQDLSAALTKQWQSDMRSSATATQAAMSQQVQSAFSTLQGQITLAQKAATADALAKAQDLVGGLRTELVAAINKGNADLGTSLRTELSAQFGKELDARDATLRGEIAKLRTSPNTPVRPAVLTTK